MTSDTPKPDCNGQCDFQRVEEELIEGGSVNHYWWDECKTCGAIGDRSKDYDLFYPH